MFSQGSTCLVVLWIPPCQSHLSLTGLSPSPAGFPKTFLNLLQRILNAVRTRNARIPVWALPFSLAATYGIDVVFSSSGYLDVSVHRVPFLRYVLAVGYMRFAHVGFPIQTSPDQRIFAPPRSFFAAYHVFHRLLVPRHPPYALYCLTNFASSREA